MNDQNSEIKIQTEEETFNEALKAEAMPDTAAKSAILDLEISVDVHVASINVLVSDVRNWLSGAIVSLQDLTVQNGLSVELRNGSRIIATGSLVQLDDAYGILIDHVSTTSKVNQ